MLEVFWKYAGSILKVFWKYSGSYLVEFWKYFGRILEVFCENYLVTCFSVTEKFIFISRRDNIRKSVQEFLPEKNPDDFL